jgi:hypothetical protein
LHSNNYQFVFDVFSEAICILYVFDIYSNLNQRDNLFREKGEFNSNVASEQKIFSGILFMFPLRIIESDACLLYLIGTNEKIKFKRAR